MVSKSRILVAVSSPWASEKLLAPVLDLAKRLDAQVLVAHVAEIKEEDESEAEAKQRGEQTLNLLLQGLKNAGLAAEGLMLFSDDVPKALLNTAATKQCTMLVMGLTGKGVLKRLIAGDVPGNIIRQANIPVLIIPANWSGQL